MPPLLDGACTVPGTGTVLAGAWWASARPGKTAPQLQVTPITAAQKRSPGSGSIQRTHPRSDRGRSVLHLGKSGQGDDIAADRGRQGTGKDLEQKRPART